MLLFICHSLSYSLFIVVVVTVVVLVDFAVIAAVAAAGMLFIATITSKLNL